MLRNKVVTAILEKSEKRIVVLNVSFKDLLEYGERNLFVDSDFIKLFLGELREVGLDVNHSVGNYFDFLVVVNLDEYDVNACLLNFDSLLLGDYLSLLGEKLTGKRSDNRLRKSCADNAVKQGKLFIIFVSADSGDRSGTDQRTDCRGETEPFQVLQARRDEAS